MAEWARPDFWPLTATFLSLAAQSLGLAVLIGLPMGILLSRLPKLAGGMMSILGALQTIPSLALLGFCISTLHLIGAPAALFAAVVYSIFPIALNAYTGLAAVDPRVKDAARGLGMNEMQSLWSIELPLAMPVILDGVRTGAVYSIGLVTLAAIVGAGGLGTYITAGMSRGDVRLILLGVVPILAITFVLFLGLGGLAVLVRRRRDLGLALAGALIGAFALYGLAVPLLHAGGSTAAAALESEAAASQSLLETWAQAEGFAAQVFAFLSLMCRGLGLALLVGLPIGVVLARWPSLAQPVIQALALVQTVPSLALLGLCVSLSGMSIGGFVVPPLFGPRAAIIATVVYSLLPIVLNTSTGLVQVDPRVKDAARGMGMTAWQSLLRVELPLAMPVIMAGVRTAAIFAIAMVTIAAMVGARGLGDYVLAGMETENPSLIWLGVLPILAITFATFWGLGGLARISQGRAGQSLCAALILLTAGYALADPFFRVRADILVGSKNFVENRLLAELIKLLIEDKTDLSVELYPNLGSSFAYKSLQAKVLDIYPEYTGTLLTAADALGIDKTPPDHAAIDRLVARGWLTDADAAQYTADRAKGDAAITDLVRRGMRRGHGLALLEPWGVNNTYAVIVPAADANRAKSIGDLSKDALVGVPQEFMERPDGWAGLTDTYRLRFDRPPLQLDPNYLYKALDARKVDAVVGLSTDWQIAGRGDATSPKLRVLQDDRGYFPSYFAAPLVREDVLKLHPEIEPALQSLAGRVPNEAMQRMIREVVIQKRRPRDVAREFLMREGIIEANQK